MMRQWKNSLVVICSLTGVFSLAFLVSTAAADRDYGRESGRARASASATCGAWIPFSMRTGT